MMSFFLYDMLFNEIEIPVPMYVSLKKHVLDFVCMLILRAMILNWVKYQIRLLLVLSYNIKTIVSMQLELLAGIL